MNRLIRGIFVGCLVFGIIMGIVGVLSLFVGIGAGDVVLIILGLIFTLPAVITVVAMLSGNTDKAKKDRENTKKRLEDKIKAKLEEENIEITQQYRTLNHSIIALDENNQKLCLLISNANDVNHFSVITDGIQEYPDKNMCLQNIEYRQL